MRNSHVINDVVKTLELIASHPAMFAGRSIHCEAYVMGLFDGIRFAIEGLPEYRRYLEESGFHEHTFMSRFEKNRNCKSDLICDGREVEEHVCKEFEEKISEHLTLFIQWSRRNNGD
jgi:hypothetical protein